MDDVIKRSLLRQFPELSGGYHLPRFGRVVAIPDAPTDAGLCDDFRPRYGVDIEVLGQDGEPDPALPILAGVPLPLPSGGEEMGMFAFPQEGTRVVICFAYGSPSHPYIQSILPHGLSLPKVPNGDQLWQHSDGVQQRVDADGNWLRQTDGEIRDQAITRKVEAQGNSEQYQSHVQDVKHHSTETVGGIKKIEALGAMRLASAGTASLAALDDMHQATGRDLNLVVGKKHNAAVGGDMEERIAGLRKSVTDVSQRLQAPKTWLGSESVNVLRVLGDTLDLIEQLASQVASHVHGPSPIPNTAAAFTADAANARLLSEELGSITL